MVDSEVVDELEEALFDLNPEEVKIKATLLDLNAEELEELVPEFVQPELEIETVLGKTPSDPSIVKVFQTKIVPIMIEQKVPVEVEAMNKWKEDVNSEAQ